MVKFAHILGLVWLASAVSLGTSPSWAAEHERQKAPRLTASKGRQEGPSPPREASCGQAHSVLKLRWTNRPVGRMQTPRRFLDFVIDGRLLFKRMSRDHDYITPLGWGGARWRELVFNELQLLAPSELVVERQALYVCPECGDLGCGSVSAVVVRQGDHVIWKNFAYYSSLDYAPRGKGSPSIRRRGYEDIGPFVFEAKAYDKTLQDAREMLSKRPTE